MDGADCPRFLHGGNVGHRDRCPITPNPAAVTGILQRLRETTVPLRLLCSMAAGADLLAAEAAAELGITIIALLPYARRLCREDLESEGERALFDRLCDMSDVVELSLPEGAGPGDVDHPGEIRDRQLQRAGLIVARYSGLMIAIRDGLNTIIAQVPRGRSSFVGKARCPPGRSRYRPAMCCCRRRTMT
jgi:hypothetical protein